MGSFKNSCVENCDKILKFANFEKMGVPIFCGTSCIYEKNLVNFFTAVAQ